MVDETNDLTPNEEEPVETPEAEKESGESKNEEKENVSPFDMTQEQIDAQKHLEFLSLTNNEDRRHFVVREFLEGKGRFSDPSHRDFFIEQATKGEIYTQEYSSEDKARLCSMLNELLIEHREEISQNVINQVLHPVPQTTSMSQTGYAHASSGQDALWDLGAREYLSDIAKLQTRDSFYKLVLEGHKQALEQKYKGEKPNDKLIGDIREARAGLKWYQFKRKRVAERALKAIDPAYYATEAVHSSWFSTSYYRLRDKLRDRNRARFNKRLTSLESALDRKKEYDKMRWLSKDAWKKLKLGTRMLFSRSIERKTNRLLSIANKAQLAEFNKRMEERFNNFGPIQTKLDVRSRNNQEAILKKIQLKSKAKDTFLDTEFNSKIQTLEATYPEQKKINERTDKFKAEIEARAQQMQADFQEAMAKHPAFRLLSTLDTRGSQELVEKAITSDKLMKKLLEEMKIDKNSAEGLRLLELFKKPQERIETNTEEEKKKQTGKEDDQDLENNKGQPTPQKLPEDPVVEEPTSEAEIPSENQQTTPVVEKEAQQSLDNNPEQKDANKDKDETAEAPRVEFGREKGSFEDGKFWHCEEKSNIFEIAKGPLDQLKVNELVAEIGKVAKDGLFVLTTQDFSQNEVKLFQQAAKENGLRLFDENGNDISEKTAQQQEVDAKRKNEKESEQDQKAKDEAERQEKIRTQQKQKELEEAELVLEGTPPSVSEENKQTNDLATALQSAMLGKKPEDQPAIMGFFTQVSNGEFNALTVQEFATKMKELGIDPKSESGIFLGNMAAEKALQSEIKEDKELAKDKELSSSLKEDAKESGLKGAADAAKMGKLSAMQTLVDEYKDKPIEEMKKDPAYALLPKYAKQGAENLVHLEQAEGKPELKSKIRGIILSHVIEGKQQSRKVSKGVKQTQLSEETFRTVAASRGKE